MPKRRRFSIRYSEPIEQSQQQNDHGRDREEEVDRDANPPVRLRQLEDMDTRHSSGAETGDTADRRQRTQSNGKPAEDGNHIHSETTMNVYHVGLDGWKKLSGDDVGELHYKYYPVVPTPIEQEMADAPAA